MAEMPSSAVTKEMTFLIMQYLEENNLHKSVHMLQQESGYYFNMKHLEELILEGNWDEIEKYVSAYTKMDDNRYSIKIYFEILKQKYLEALDRQDRAAAVDILVKDLKIFASCNEELYKEMTQLLTLNDLRENAQLSSYGDVKTARVLLVQELKKLIEANPLFGDKLTFPKLDHSRLWTLVNQSLNWQHRICPIPNQKPEMKTLLVDHVCRHSNDPFGLIAANGQASQRGAALRADAFNSADVNASFQALNGRVKSPLSSWTPILPSVNRLSASSGPIGFGIQTNPALFSTGTSNPEDLFRTRLPGVVMPGINQGHVKTPASSEVDEFPTTVSRILDQGSVPTSLDFHPQQHTLLLVGTNLGIISVWEVSSKTMLVTKGFASWDMGSKSVAFKAAVVKDPSVSVNRVVWSPNGSVFGVAYSKHIIQLYVYQGSVDEHKEIEAHVGSVNDLAFCTLNNQLRVITCGDDKAIKVWDAITGSRLYIFSSHTAPVHYVCPHSRENTPFLFSTSVDGQIKAWVYDQSEPRINYKAPNMSCTKMVYSADGKRLFSCGTNKDGESNVVEWDENEGTIKRNYQGLQKQSFGIVQIDTTKNKYLAVGDDYAIKVWDMDNANVLFTVDAEGNLPANPHIRFNKEGSLLAVSTNNNTIKVLATTNGIRLMHNYEKFTLTASKKTPEKNDSTGNMQVNKKERLSEELNKKNIWNLTVISESAQIRSSRFSVTSVKADKIARLVYTNSGNAILALASNGTHLLWKWRGADASTNGKATTTVAPLFVIPASGAIMINDLSGAKPEHAVPCCALSKNDSYVMSASGGKVSLFNLMTFKTMTSFMSPPPEVTCLAFHPDDNNIVAVGFNDSTIHIYNVRTDKVTMKLAGHSKAVTGLAFSQLLKTLVSSGADYQIVSWSSDKWEMQKNCSLQITPRTTPATLFGTHLQYHKDQKHFLFVHMKQLSIFETSGLECRKTWDLNSSSAHISYATFSGDCELVYASFTDGILRVFTSELNVQCQINPNAYLPLNIRSTTLPLVIAANPQEPNQFAVGLTDGAVVVLEPLEGDKWGVPPPADENLVMEG